MITDIVSRKKGMFILFVLSIVALSMSIVAAFTVIEEGGSCTATSECVPGTACEDGICTAICTIGETACSDGIDNDGDGSYDYWGACFTDSMDTEANDCSTFDSALECADTCKDYIYYDADPECRSPLDNDESSDPRCADGKDNDGDGFIDYPNDADCDSPEDDIEITVSGEPGLFRRAAEEERGFFEKLWDWLIFWK